MKKFILLFIIAIFALVLRTYNIQNVPPSLSWDEVSIGYNAYSILTTGKDEHGKVFPIDAFVGYGDYKPPFSVYLTVPFVAVFGLNELAVRLPSALFGTLTVLLTYFLVVELFGYGLPNFAKASLGKRVTRYGLQGKASQSDNPSPVTRHTETIALLAMLLLAISPWHINLSRAGFEANIALFFVVLGVFLLLKTRENKTVWYGAWFPFVVAIYTFNSSRYFVPIFSVGLLMYLWPFWKKSFKQFIIGSVIAGILLFPLVPHLMSPQARLRFTEVNIFTNADIVKKANDRIERNNNSFVSKVLDNRRVGFAREYLIHFFDNFEPAFLFVKGDGNPKFSIQDVGQMYLVEAPFFIIGLFSLFIIDWKIGLLLLYWIIASIIPAATARETPHALRILNSLPTWQIFTAVGIYTIMSNVKCQMSNVKNTKIYSFFVICFLTFVSCLMLFSFVFYLHNYYRHYPIEFSGEWQYGYREALSEVKKIEQNYSSIIISDTIGRPYMYTLFYTGMNPNEYLKSKNSAFDDQGFYHVYGFGKYVFNKTLPDMLDPHTLYVWDSGNVPAGAHIIKTIRLLNGNPILTVFDMGN